ncbi:uncharacterized protein LOC126673834 [Mercurialis annua]|uniref:uncharacterized protein LOC126673834 n=1 Tax=Mercurialis annua TaxID=3986 RepID=UPI00215EDEC6|nr:uncharacterized protein LOC126673834 [Mercurialis annua]
MATRSELCPRYLDSETTYHLLFHCPFASVVWSGWKKGNDLVDSENTDFVTCWISLVEKLSKMEGRLALIQEAAWVLWSIWLARNAMIFRDEFKDLWQVLNEAAYSYHEFQQATNVERLPAAPNPEALPSCWQPPPPLATKINFDGAFIAASRTGSGACVARDSAGKILSSYAFYVQHAATPSLMEALALRASINLAMRLRLQNTIFEGDAKGIIEAMKYGSNLDSNCDVILNDCRKLCENLQGCSFFFVRRNCNWVAHRVAKKALRDREFYNNPLAQIV